MISIVIPYFNDKAVVGNLVEQIGSNVIDEQYEILIIDGGSDKSSRDTIDEIAARNPRVRVLDNILRITSCALNIGIRAAKGEFIILLSAHCAIADNYIRVLVRECRETGADVIGAKGYTDTLENSKQAVSIKSVLSDKFGVGNAHYRTDVKGIMEADTVAYGCYRKGIFDEVGLFDERLVRNQDLELNKRIKKHGGKVYLTPDTYFIYYARDNYKDFYRNNFGNGYWSIVTPYILKDFRSESLRHYVPFLFVISVITLLILSFISPVFAKLDILIILSYLLLLIGNSIKIKLKRSREATISHLMAAFIVLHLSYGLGSLKGLLDIIRGKFRRRGITNSYAIKS